MIRYDVKSTMKIALNNNTSYDVLIMDPKIHILSSSPSTIPRGKVSLLKGSSTNTEVYLKVFETNLKYLET